MLKEKLEIVEMLLQKKELKKEKLKEKKREKKRINRLKTRT